MTTVTVPTGKNVLTRAEFEDQFLQGTNTFRNVIIGSNLIIKGFGDSKTIGGLHIINSEICGIEISGLTIGDFTLNGTRLDGDLVARNTRFTKPIRLIGTKINGKTDLVGARIMSDVLCGDNIPLALKFFLYAGGKVHLDKQAIEDFIGSLELAENPIQ